MPFPFNLPMPPPKNLIPPGYEYRACGAFQCAIPQDYIFLLNSQRRDEVLQDLWWPYFSKPGHLSFADIHAKINRWEADRTHGMFWNNGWGREHRVFLNAIRLIDAFSEFIPDDGEYCENAGEKIRRQLKGRGYGLWSFTDAPYCDKGNESFVRYDCLSYPFFPTKIEINSETGWNLNGNVGVCKFYLESMAEAADMLLWQAATLRSLAQAGYQNPLYPSMARYDYPDLALYMARLALGNIAAVARTLLHEMIHVEFPFKNHCKLNCCMQRLALKWFCRVAGYNGLFSCDWKLIDIELKGEDFSYNSGCDGEGEESDFFGKCKMNLPGIAAMDPDHVDSYWYKSQEWENPDGCPP